MISASYPACDTQDSSTAATDASYDYPTAPIATEAVADNGGRESTEIEGPIGGAKAYVWIAVIFAVFALILQAGKFEHWHDAKGGAKNAVDKCWGKQVRKSAGDSTQNYMLASVCEKLEDDFIRTYSHKP